jgi:hypothetical protein
MVLTDVQIREIADGLESGMRCYYNRLTGDIRTIIDFERWADADREFWEEDLKEIEEHYDDYLVFDNLTSNDSFEIMSDFADTITDSKILSRLINALSNPKPFSNFKHEIDNSEDYRLQWFEFKTSRYIDWVKEQIDFENRKLKNE